MKKFYQTRVFLIIIYTIFLMYIFHRFTNFNDTNMALNFRNRDLKVGLDFGDFLDNLTPPETLPDDGACKLPQLDPYHWSILPFITKNISVKCEIDKYPLVFASGEDSQLIQLADPNDFGLESCCFRKLMRISDGDHYVRVSLNCHAILNNITKLKPSFEFISIECLNITSEDVEVIELLSWAPLKPIINIRNELLKNKTRNQTLPKPISPRLNVVMLGLDGVSHMNLQRILPKSYSFLKQNLSAIGMKGYNKVGENTFPNALAFISGMTESQLKKKCWSTKSSFFDDCPFIWKDFQAEGFATSFSEDAPSISIFNFEKRGFNNPPVDYYLRPFTYKMDSRIGHWDLISSRACYGRRSGFRVLLDYFKQVATTMQKNHQKYFQLTWETSLFHDYLNLGKNGDDDLLEALEWFKTSGYFNNTVFIFMSDHGSRWEEIRQTEQGKLEDRMPFLYFVLPKWFRKMFPEAVRNLKGNVPRLTSPFDLHETLLDLVNLDKINGTNILARASKRSKRGRSLFLPISYQRKCADAGISSHFCVCNADRNKRPVPAKFLDQVKFSAEFSVSKINEKLVTFKDCALLRLDRIFSAAIVIKESTKNWFNVVNPVFELNLGLQTIPGNGTFEVTLSRDEGSLWNVQEITRTNLYGNQSRCVSDYEAKNFCYCY